MYGKLEEEKILLGGKIEDFGKLKVHAERLRERVEELDSVNKILKELDLIKGNLDSIITDTDDIVLKQKNYSL